MANAYAGDPKRYARPSLDALRAKEFDLAVLPDEPYEFTESFLGRRCVLVSGRHLTWCGLSLVEAHAQVGAALWHTVAVEFRNMARPTGPGC